MKSVLWMLIAFCLLMGPAGNASAVDGDKGQLAGPGPVKEEKASAESGRFDETTTQFLKKQRSIDAELVAAYRELHRYNNPDKAPPRGVSMADLIDQESALREARQQEQITRTKKASTEERIGVLHKDIEKLKQDLLRHYNGKLPRDVSDAWQTEEGYTSYLISKYK